jgi:hypothetical protein
MNPKFRTLLDLQDPEYVINVFGKALIVTCGRFYMYVWCVLNSRFRVSNMEAVRNIYVIYAQERQHINPTFCQTNCAGILKRSVPKSLAQQQQQQQQQHNKTIDGRLDIFRNTSLTRHHIQAAQNCVQKRK